MFLKSDANGKSKKINQATSLTSVLLFVILLVVVGTGMWIRFSATSDRITANIQSYYYHRSLYLLETGALPEKDIWSFAPAEIEENIPPLLAYATVGLFGLTRVFVYPFGAEINFTDFVIKLPVIFYALWILTAMFFMHKSSPTEEKFTFVTLLTFVPVAIILTQHGQYSEEIIGVPLVFFAFFFLLRLSENETFQNFVGLFVSTLLLILAWPQFPTILIAILFTALALWFFEKKLSSLLIIGSMLASLFIAHFLSIYILNLDYSPLKMLNEAQLGFTNYRDPDIRLAMGRSNWANPNPFDILGYFSGAGTMLFAFGIWRIFLFHQRIKDVLLIIFSATTLPVFLLFSKSVSLFLPVFLLVASYGGEMILSKAQMNKLLFEPITRFFSIRSIRRFVKITLALSIIVFASLFLEHVLWHFSSKPHGKIIINGIPQQIEIGKSYPVAISLENGDIPTTKSPRSFAGLHIEIKNALIKDMQAFSPSGGRVATKPNIISGDWFWFETAFPVLGANQNGSTSFTLTPLSKDIEISVRGWLPGPCSFIAILHGISGRTGSYWNPLTEGWRSELCLVRIPESKTGPSPEIDDCAIDVFAGYRAEQKFKCLKYELLKNGE